MTDPGSVKLFADNPAEFFEDSHTAMGSIPRRTMEKLQLSALQWRFASLQPEVPVLQKLAEKQGITSLATVDDVVPLLFEHSIYKSYPRKFLEKFQFTNINQWLGKLTSHPISEIDVSQCTSIDDWLGVMESQTPLRITHSSGTTGTMSFLPHSEDEYDALGRSMRMCFLQNFGDKRPASFEPYQVIFPFYRYGFSSQIRGNTQYIKWLAQGEDNFHTPFNEHMSSDVLYLAARVRHATLTGTLDRLEISESLLSRQSEFEAAQAAAPEILNRFFERLFNELRGETIFTIGTWNLLLDLAKTGLEKGQEAIFSGDSVVLSGGGAKGMTPPADWKADVCRFIGARHIGMNYAMSEVMGFNKMCSAGRYHIVPWLIPFVLDANTSHPLPRKGVVTGRAAFFDLMARHRWGGLITGDEVTIDWDTKCECGQETYHLAPTIKRFSEKTGDDDKITCAAQPQAHAEAMDFLANYSALV